MLEPRKVKVYLGQIKEILDVAAAGSVGEKTDEETSSVALECLCTTYRTLVLTELVQRGVFVAAGAGGTASAASISTTTTTTTTPESPRKLLEAIISAAGKALIEEEGGGGLPKPLLAASCALSGMASEKCAELCANFCTGIYGERYDEKEGRKEEGEQVSSEKPTAASYNLLLDGRTDDRTGTSEKESLLSLYEKAVTRCSDVDDDRLLVLLRLADATHVLHGRNITEQQQAGRAAIPSSSSSSSVQKSTSDETQSTHLLMQTWRCCFLQLAAGYYLRAAVHFAGAEQPQPWKRCLDVVVQLHSLVIRQSRARDAFTVVGSKDGDYCESKAETEQKGQQVEEEEYSAYRTWDVTLPLTNLIRIAESKGNARRATELRLKLADSYVSEYFDTNSKNIGDDGGMRDEIKNTFVRPFYRDGADQSGHDGRKQRVLPAKLAIETLSKCDITLLLGNDESENNRLLLLYNIVCFRVLLAHENATIDLITEERYNAMKNRSPENNDNVGRGGVVGLSSTSKRSGTRSGVSLSSDDVTSSTSKEGIALEVRREVLTGLSSFDEYVATVKEQTIDEVALSLRDLVLVIWKYHDTGGDGSEWTGNSTSIMVEAYQLLEVQVNRLVDKAQAIALYVRGNCSKKLAKQKFNLDGRDGAWNAVALFLQPLLSLHSRKGSTEAERKVDNNDTYEAFIRSLSLFGRTFIEAAAEAVITVLWMRGSDFATSKNTHFNLVQPAQLILSICLKLRNEDEQKEKLQNALDDKVMKAGASVQDKASMSAKIGLECALSAATCRIGLSRVGAGNVETSTDETNKTTSVGSMIKQATEDALKMSKRTHNVTYSSFHAKFGNPYLHFALSWSGLHYRPWQFSNVTQARTIIRYARESLDAIATGWGRDMSMLETILLDLGEANSEGGLLPGGFIHEAEKIYKQTLAIIEDPVSSANKSNDHDLSSQVLLLLKAHCLCGLSRISLFGDSQRSKVFCDEDCSAPTVAEHYARMSLDVLESFKSRDGGVERPTVYLWSSSHAFDFSVSYHVSLARQLVAEALLRASRPQDARAFLEDAVRDAPNDFDAVFALGAFRLRTVLFGTGERDGLDGSPATVEKKKMAQTQLLKAAKLDSSKADPFALLGLWYEVHGDHKRAVGCHSKALILDPSHPVAGRGILRVKPFEDIMHLCDKATNLNSPVNGWAWRAIGRAKAMSDGDDTLAVVCFQQALRCRDIESPQNETLGVFYSDPTQPSNPDRRVHVETAEVWSELAGCYRRLGKFSAAIRAYNWASEVSGGEFSSKVLCSWGQVELDLGLHDEAVAKFEKVLDSSESTSSRSMAAYGQGSGLLAIARRDFEEGKFRAAVSHLKQGIDGLKCVLVSEDRGEANPMKSNWICALKLLGDLYSFGAYLPSDVFVESSNVSILSASTDDMNRHEIDPQVSFVAQGEKAYESALASLENRTDFVKADENSVLLSCAACDLGTNILLQARLLSSLYGEGSGTKTAVTDIVRKKTVVRDFVHRAVKRFLKAIETNEFVASAWCGLGSALCCTDPLLAQHAFCRALQLDKSLPDAWANLGILYADRGLTRASSELMDSLTQVADSPLMWICRGLLLEDMASGSSQQLKSSSKSANENLNKAADAYRAALQVAQHPCALLGLSLTCQRLGLREDGIIQDRDYVAASELVARIESRGFMDIYLQATGGYNVGASFLGGAMRIEDGLVRLAKTDNSCAEEVIQEGADMVRRGCKILDRLVADNEQSSAKLELAMGPNEKDITTNGDGLPSDVIAELAKVSLDSVGTCDSFDTKDRRRVDDVETEQEMLVRDELSLARKRVHESPEKGDLWLYFAKELMKEWSGLRNPVSKVQAWEECKIAATKAALLLSDMLVHVCMLTPRRPVIDVKSGDGGEQVHSPQKPVSPEPIEASLISESLALEVWLRVIENDDIKETKHGYSPITSANLQRAIIMDPENAFARAALESLQQVK